MRRYSRRSQPRPASITPISHTSAAAASDTAIELSVDYLATIDESLHRAKVEQEVWAGEIILVATVARAEKRQSRRQALEEAQFHVERQRYEQKLIRDERLVEQRAHLAQWQARQKEEIERIRREQEAVEQRRREEQAAEELERRRRERLRTCTVCMEDNEINTMVQTPCQHWYCRTCLREGFEAALASRTPFQCCHQNASIALVADILPDDFIARYELMVLEHNTPNPTYCANIQCGIFIPPANYHGPDSARCSRCDMNTCRHCRTTGHTGRGCTTDQATEQVRVLAREFGWKACPSCGTMVEKNKGCLHMTCLSPCRYEFCWRCSGPWRECRSNCI